MNDKIIELIKRRRFQMLIHSYLYYKTTGENPLTLADEMKPDGFTVVATPKWRSVLKIPT